MDKPQHDPAAVAALVVAFRLVFGSKLRARCDRVSAGASPRDTLGALLPCGNAVYRAWMRSVSGQALVSRFGIGPGGYAESTLDVADWQASSGVVQLLWFEKIVIGERVMSARLRVIHPEEAARLAAARAAVTGEGGES